MPVNQIAKTQVQVTVEQQLIATQQLMQRVYRIESNPKFSEELKKTNTSLLKVDIEKNFLKMETLLKAERRKIAIEYQRVRREQPKNQAAKHRRLAHLRKQSAALQDLSRFVETQHGLSKANIGYDDPEMASMPMTPSSRPVMTKESLDFFIKTARVSWAKVDREITRYAQENRYPVKEVKGQVIDALLAVKFDQVFDNKPTDVSRTRHHRH